MTVSELIEELRKYPGDMPVVSVDSQNGELETPDVHKRTAWRYGDNEYGNRREFAHPENLTKVEIVGIW